MVEIISKLVGNDLLATIVMSIFPLIELKGGIVFARGVGMGFFQSLLFAYIGSTIVFIPIFFLLRPVLNLLKKIKFISKLATKAESYCEQKAQSAFNKDKENSKADNVNFLKWLGVFIFVAIPLPMTGVWTGTAIAVFLNLKFKDALMAIIAGNLVAGLLISLLASLCTALWSITALDYILYALFALAIIFLIVLIIKVVMQKPKKESSK